MHEANELSTDLENLLQQYKPYLYELRIHIVVTVVLFVVGFLLGLVSSQHILGLVLQLFQFEGVKVITTSPFQFIDISFSISFLMGIFLAFPYAFFRLYLFVRPALRRNEQKFIISFLPLSFGLFFLGFFFGIKLMQMVISLYSHMNSAYTIGSFWDIQHFLSQIFFTSFLTGLIFQIPIVMSALIRLHIVPYREFARKRKIIYAGLVVVAILLPTKDLLSVILETFPLFFLFELGLVLNRKNRRIIRS